MRRSPLANDFVTRRDIEALQKSAAGATRYLEASLQNAEVAADAGHVAGTGGALALEERRSTALQRPTAAKTVAMAAMTRAVRQACRC
jgi:hypothetical protein